MCFRPPGRHGSPTSGSLSSLRGPCPLIRSATPAPPGLPTSLALQAPSRPPGGALRRAVIAYAAELGLLASMSPTASDSPRISVASPPNRRFSPPPVCLRHRLPSQVEPYRPAVGNSSPPFEIAEISFAPKLV